MLMMMLLLTRDMTISMKTSKRKRLKGRCICCGGGGSFLYVHGYTTTAVSTRRRRISFSSSLDPPIKRKMIKEWPTRLPFYNNDNIGSITGPTTALFNSDDDDEESVTGRTSDTGSRSKSANKNNQNRNGKNGNGNRPKMTTSSTPSSKKKNFRSNKSKFKSKNKNNSQSRSKKQKQLSPEEKRKQEILQQVQEKIKMNKIQNQNQEQKEQDQQSKNNKSKSKINNTINPFQAGRQFRKTIDSFTRGFVAPTIKDPTMNEKLYKSSNKNLLYLDDRFLETSTPTPTSSSLFGSDSILLKGRQRQQLDNDDDKFSSSPLLNLFGNDDDVFVPEVLVVGATGSVGRLVVRRLLLEGKSKVRVLVRDLYSDTLNLLGTGVTYCQGDLSNVESLEYAVTDVDKIVYVAGAPRPDEKGWQTKMERIAAEYRNTNDPNEVGSDNVLRKNDVDDDEDDDGNVKKSGDGDRPRVGDQWEEWAATLETRARLAEQVDMVGMGNLVRAYQNVRHADFGTSQAAKRSLFKFSGRAEDFHLFSIDEEERSNTSPDPVAAQQQLVSGTKDSSSDFTVNQDKTSIDMVDSFGSDYDYDDYYDVYEDSYEDMVDLEYATSRTGPTKSQVQWLRNKFGNGVFVGRVPRATPASSSSSTGAMASATGGEAAIRSSRLRSRDDPESGIDLSTGSFAGFVVRLLGDGGTYEAFIRTKLFEEEGIEYICPFTTDTKPTSNTGKSRNRFKTVRLGFESFRPVIKKRDGIGRSHDGEDLDKYDDAPMAPPFLGSDVRYIGFRFKASSNISPKLKLDKLKGRSAEYQSFYIAFDYIKVFRNQPEPEFIYLSDARIPPTIKNGMVDHKQRRLLSGLRENGDSSTLLLDDETLKAATTLTRSPEETYYKYRGEEILKSSGLSYTIIRIAGFNELPTSEASTIDLLSGHRLEKTVTNDGNGGNDGTFLGGEHGDAQTDSGSVLIPVSRAEVAQVCVSALMDPYALNKSLYMSKKTSRRGSDSFDLDTRVVSTIDDEDISKKFEAIPTDGVSP